MRLKNKQMTTKNVTRILVGILKECELHIFLKNSAPIYFFILLNKADGVRNSSIHNLSTIVTKIPIGKADQVAQCS